MNSGMFPQLTYRLESTFRKEGGRREGGREGERGNFTFVQYLQNIKMMNKF